MDILLEDDEAVSIETENMNECCLSLTLLVIHRFGLLITNIKNNTCRNKEHIPIIYVLIFVRFVHVYFTRKQKCFKILRLCKNL